MHTDITRSRQDAEALAALSEQTARRERLLGKTLSSISELAFAFDRDGRIIFANDPALRFWGVTMEQAVGRTVLDLDYPQELALRIQRQIAHVFATGTSVEDETEFPLPGGDIAHYEYTFSPAVGPDGGVEFGVGFSRDVTGRKQVENALWASVAEFVTLAAAIPQVVWTSDGGGRILSLNQRWVDHTGLPFGSAIGRSWPDLLHEHDPASPRLSWPQDPSAGRGFTSEIRLRGKDGRFGWWLMRGVPVRDGRGMLLKWLGTCTDVDELKRAEMEVSRANAELQRQRTELRALFDMVPAMIWSKDTLNNFVRVNRRAASSVGRSVEDVEGRSAHEIYPAKAEAFMASDQAIIQSQQPIMGKLEVFRDPQGNERWMQKDKVPYFDADGKVIGVLVMSQDITERKRDQDALRELNAELEERVRRRTAELALARDEAERANAAKSAFLATMSHEIRTPMSGLLGLLELLELTELTGQQRDTLHVARESGKALHGIIDGILDFSRIEANALELDLQPARIQAVIDTARRLHAQVAACKGVALVTHVDPEISRCLVLDPLRLGQILNNLLANAIKFTERGEVRVSVDLVSRSQGQEALRLTVRDTGVGIASHQVSRLFKPFAQAGAQTSTRFGGTGLGLFISRRLAELMGGSLQLESRLGQGTVLTLDVAFTTCDEAAIVRPTATPARAGKDSFAQAPGQDGVAAEAPADGLRLLVVDDHPVNRLVLVRQADALGHAAEAVESGEDALRAWESGRFAVMLVDCNMPGMSGYELVRRIRSLEVARGLHRVPIVGCTANALASATAACLDAGMDDVLTKPVDLLRLSEALDLWLPLRGGDPAGAHQQGASAHPAPPPNQGLLDLAMLAAISHGDLAMKQRVLRQLQTTNEGDAAALREAVDGGEHGRAVRHAHRMRGACSMLGATALADVCSAVQEAAERQDSEELASLMEEFDRELLRLHAYLDSLA